ncbi:MAG: lipocalin family protein [Dysgonomonas sp.]
MKLRNILGLTLCAFILGSGFTSCSDDDDKKVEPKVFSGTFKFSESEAEVTVTNPEIKEQVEEAVNAYSKGGTYVFKLDGTYAFKSDDQATSRESGESGEVSGTYKLEGDKLTLTSGDTTESLTYTETVIRSSQDVAAKVIEDLELAEGVVTKALQIDVFEKMTK